MKRNCPSCRKAQYTTPVQSAFLNNGCRYECQVCECVFNENGKIFIEPRNDKPCPSCELSMKNGGLEYCRYCILWQSYSSEVWEVLRHSQEKSLTTDDVIDLGLALTNYNLKAQQERNNEKSKQQD